MGAGEMYRDLLPPLSSEEFAALRADIEANGVRAAVFVDEEGDVLDGHHRLTIEPKAPRKVIKGLSPGEKEAFVFRSNFARRNMSDEQKASIRARMKETALILKGEGKTQADIGDLLGVAQNTVSVWFAKASTNINGDNSCTTQRIRDGRQKLTHDDKQEILGRGRKGETPTQIAADFKVSRQHVDHVLKAEKAKAERRKEAKARAVEAAVKGPAIRIVEGDALTVLKDIDDTFDLLLADPPYNVMDVGWDTIGDRKAYLAFMKKWIALAQKRLRPHHHAFVFCSPSYAADLEIMLRDDLGTPLQSRAVWHHKNLSMGRVVGNGLINSWDAILHWGTHPLNFPDEWGAERFDVQIHAVPQTNFKDEKVHQAQKPIDLIRWLVSIGSKEGQTVLDPFGGGGTTAAACRALTRGCLTIEKDPAFVKVIRGRVA